MKKVLLLEDSSFQRKVIAMKLGKLDISLREVGDPQEALIYLEVQDFDLVITDLNLPGMSGLEFIQKFRSFNERTPVIGITSPGSSIHGEAEVKAAGAAFVLSKPLEDIEPIEKMLKK